MLASLAAQTRLPDEVIIIDEDESSRELVDRFPKLNICVIAVPGSASRKRNAGVEATRSDTTLVGFMDDDIVVEPTAIEAMAAFWKLEAPGLAGAGCNYANAPRGFGQGLKQLAVWSTIGLYESRPGSVARSGFQTRITDFRETVYVRWLPSGATFYAKGILKEFRFDEWFENYSYLEDLDFSYRIGEHYKLAVVADARFYHYPSQFGRPSAYQFGKKEVLNRLYFVSKHPELSRPMCYFALAIRSLMTILLGFMKLERGNFKRVVGNLVGLLLGIGCLNPDARRRRSQGVA
jgi:GT2 family glycosyltransferase